MQPVLAVVMAGGLGMRLWPKSTERKPKQFVHVMGDGTLIQNTVARLQPFIQTDDVYVVTTDDLEQHVRDQLPAVPVGNIIREPFGRNTGPCIALAATALRKTHGDDAILVILPSDHVIQNVREFQSVLNRACTAAMTQPCVVTIGVMPTRPETGFGYIQYGDDVETTNPIIDGRLQHVRTFAEKPDSATAQRFIDAGDFVWNSGIFVSRIGVLLDTIHKHLPDHGPLFQLYARAIGHDDERDVLENVYRQIRSISFDIGVMEKAQNACVVEGAFGWSDVGTWDELYRMSMKDSKNNVLEGNVVTQNSTNCFVNGSSGRLIGLVGVDNLIVVETETSILICERGQSEKTRDLVEILRRRHITRHL